MTAHHARPERPGRHAQLADMEDQLAGTLRTLVRAFAAHGIHLGAPEARSDVDVFRWQALVWRAADKVAEAHTADGRWWVTVVLQAAAREWVSAATQYTAYSRSGAPWCVRDFAAHAGQVGVMLGRWEARVGPTPEYVV
ncbi:hypothetical protein HNR23_002270 [Nocardiopsis mwathae]|uniref:SAV-6107-like HEPN domain-containing protein n=1 Tax=Nocardiopsis mwathae TaxID=1472723 RepID=A0A7W9YHE7_9ACTN|nr:hypothetical protein [Nocardiopsis mwathae]MBB6172210.1 hypothetical protein [Nocardiopsis mwathae]